ncbi:hypothetical protein [Streptomyces sp. 2-1]|uniref:hypothetical protein n=1 Tax=Streptomyces sp. 2-1 TaxID=412710 RepID=UPI003AFA59AC
MPAIMPSGPSPRSRRWLVVAHPWSLITPAGRSGRRQPQQNRAAGHCRVELADLGFGPGEADAEPIDLAEPAFVLGFADPIQEVVADLHQPAALGGVGA